MKELPAAFIEKLEKVVLNDRFIYSDRVKRAFISTIRMNEHCMLYGKGGHGKSEMIMHAFEQLGIDPFVKSFHETSSVTDLFGGMDMKLYKDKGEIKYLFENSLFNHEFVIAEEAFDAPAMVWASVKDALTSGYVRTGKQHFPIKTRCIFFLTNRSKSELNEDDSVEAFLQRIPFTLKVEWDSYTPRDYSNLLEKVFADRNVPFATVVSNMSNQSPEDFISPRTCVKAYNTYITLGLDALCEFEGFSVEKVEDMKKQMVKIEEEVEQDKRLDKFAEAIKKVMSNEPRYKQEATLMLKAITEVQNKLRILSVSDALYNRKQEMLEGLKVTRNKLVAKTTTLPKS